jgi:DNA mismatch repair protein MutL
VLSSPQPNRIHILEPLVAERIAAGEVIERPGAVVKECVENSIDAGATIIHIHLEDGGKSLIEITDNGSGMTPDDLTLSIQRHATSKIQKLHDLDHLSTLGFRGEALPSIFAVSDATLVSQTLQTPAHCLTSLDPRAKPTTAGHFNGSLHGTRVTIRSLFSEIPARLKFLKSASSEIQFIKEWVERCALINPAIEWKLTHQQNVHQNSRQNSRQSSPENSHTKTILHLHPSDELSRVKTILLDDQPISLLTFNSVANSVESELLGVRQLRIYCADGYSLPTTKKLIQIVNHRAIKDRLLQSMILNPLKQSFLPGQYPALVCFLELDPSALDVNVHPTKTEVRFLNPSLLYRAFDEAIKKLLEQKKQSFYESPNPINTFSSDESTLTTPAFSYDSSQSTSNSLGSLNSTDLPASQSALDFKDKTYFSSRTPLISMSRFKGILFQTYFMFEGENELALIDQHAAHERIRYEQLKNEITSQQLMIQQLLIPEVLHCTPLEQTALQERLGFLKNLGFDADWLGDQKIIFRSIPTHWGNHQLNARLKSLIERLIQIEPQELASHSNHNSPHDLHNNSLGWDSKLFEKIAMEACRSSIKAGDSVQPHQVKSLIEKLEQCEHPWNCPHGRPTLITVSRLRFEELFLRKV